MKKEETIATIDDNIILNAEEINRKSSPYCTRKIIAKKIFFDEIDSSPGMQHRITPLKKAEQDNLIENESIL